MRFNQVPYLAFQLIIWVTLVSLTACESKKDPVDNKQIGRTYIKKTENGFELIRDGKPYYIHGACAKENLASIKTMGGNSVRIYQSNEALKVLDEAHELGLTVALTIWLDHSSYYDYSDETKAKIKLAFISNIVEKYKDHPALLMWCIGNEFQWNQEPDIGGYKFLNKVSKFIHEKDPNHPTATVVPGYPRKHIPAINFYCKDLDLICFNKFGDLKDIYEKSENFIWGYDGPIIFSEYGSHGYWDPYLETAWDMPIEPNDTMKAQTLEKIYTQMKSSGRVLGGYAFYWGNKMENTKTWFNLYGPNGERTLMLEAIKEEWSGTGFENSPPIIKNFEARNKEYSLENRMEPGDLLDLTYECVDPENDSLSIEIKLYRNSKNVKNLEDKEIPPKELILTIDPAELASGKIEHITLPPDEEGPMRLYIFVRDGNNNLASANIPIFVLKQD